MKFIKNKAFHFNKVGVEGWVYVGKNQFPKAGVVLVKVDGKHETIIKSTKSAWIYFIIKGKGKFVIDQKEFTCEREDVIIVPKDTSFYYQGKMKMLLVTVPAWEEKYEIIVGKA